ncbi:hypothetical protein N9903_01875, partial [bacterium]|nr:hypothetical protein [bacterium]
MLKSFTAHLFSVKKEVASPTSGGGMEDVLLDMSACEQKMIEVTMPDSPLETGSTRGDPPPSRRHRFLFCPWILSLGIFFTLMFSSSYLLVDHLGADDASYLSHALTLGLD